ncbi:uncharacterized protein MELLADRAFT_70183 [Melampsora larici-populina 98AG31]|uniref:Uncharacterized protein n=1 Tax=Melampsora larici-populina (strain 98AG31 / pathotype 3-4-7) TaxID=747676 RepID=F4SDY1_MELLP|nr:uncharacterized protein MELLADRAFT_70183 [Melampsora larici-populina 98AG31]EGF97145.1 hypothetical protein MELLADRAFT_70183 [Melampsora larici-populina 98AG31]
MDPHHLNQSSNLNQNHTTFTNQFAHPLRHMNQVFPGQQSLNATFDPMHFDPTHVGANSQTGFTGFDSPHFDLPQFDPNQSAPNQIPRIHQPQPQGGRISTLSRLENEVESNTEQLSAASASTTAQDANNSKKKNCKTKKTKAPAVDSTRMIVDEFMSKDVFTEIGGITLDGQTRSPEELMAQKSLGQLRHSAENVGKGNLSEEDEIHFMNFHDNITKSMAINCLARGVKLSAVETFLGHKKPFRDLTRWHGFQQAPENRQICRDCEFWAENQLITCQTLTPVGSYVDKGVKDGKATTALKRKYDQLTEEEKDTYKPKSKLAVIIDEIEASNVGGTGQESSNGAGDGQDSRNIGSAAQESTSAVRFKSRSFATDSDKIIKWLREANIQLRRLCATYHLEGVIMVVSTHVSHGSVQLFRGTQGAINWHDATKALKPQDNCLANLQAYVLGRKVGLESLVDNKPKTDKSLAKAQLGQMLSDFTNGKHTQWPWKNCVSTLKSWGYEVLMLPGAASDLNWITGLTGSNALTSMNARLILKDLNGDMIQLKRNIESAVPASLDPNNPADQDNFEGENSNDL